MKAEAGQPPTRLASAQPITGPERCGEAPAVSFVMSMRNSEATLGLCLRSLQSQTVKDWELVLIDDGSSDGSVDLAVGVRDSRIRVHAFAVSAGLPTRLNQGVELARGEFIARMDADDISYPERLERQLEHIDRYDLDLVGSGAVVFCGDGQAVGCFKVPSNHADIVARPWAGFPLPHPSWLGRADWFRANRYDPAKRYAQDQDLLLRAHRGSRLGAVSEPLLGYRQARISIEKSLVGRWNYSLSMIGEAARRSCYRTTAVTVAQQAVKAAADALLLACGREEVLRRRRYAPIGDMESRRWDELWRVLNEPGPSVGLAAPPPRHKLRPPRLERPEGRR